MEQEATSGVRRCQFELEDQSQCLVRLAASMQSGECVAGDPGESSFEPIMSRAIRGGR